MAQPRRKYRLADSKHKNVNLRLYRDEIIDTINHTVPGKNPQVHECYFSTDPLTQSEAVAIGRALSKSNVLQKFGKTVITFRLFDGKTYESEYSNTPIKTPSKDKSKNKP
ncbi:MAG: hypothetical protein E7655_02870 [Ruminococcaceae bacterium]|nr:hypothetical protein [Oscillospiraceae bacterium]